MRNKFPNSFFFPPCYDEAILGVDAVSESIIYEWMGIGHLFIVHCEGTYGDFGDRVDGASRMIAWAQKLTDEDLQGKVSPSIIMFNEDIEHWDNRHTVIYVPVNRKDHPLDNKVADSFIDD